MVYNYYHRLLTVATQKAIQALSASSLDFDDQFNVARSLINKFPVNNFVGNFLSQYKYSPTAELADALFQPVEFCYTVETLNELVKACDLTLVQPTLKRYDKTNNINEWNLQFESELEDKYNSLPDPERWQITNLLMLNDSSLLWFYLQRNDSNFKRKSESQLCEEFLQRRFKKFSTEISNFFLQEDSSYLQENQLSFPLPKQPSHEMAEKVYKLVEPTSTIQSIFNRLDIKDSFYNVNTVRLALTTSEHPYIEAVN